MSATCFGLSAFIVPSGCFTPFTKLVAKVCLSDDDDNPYCVSRYDKRLATPIKTYNYNVNYTAFYVKTQYACCFKTNLCSEQRQAVALLPLANKNGSNTMFKPFLFFLNVNLKVLMSKISINFVYAPTFWATQTIRQRPLQVKRNSQTIANKFIQKNQNTK